MSWHLSCSRTGGLMLGYARWTREFKAIAAKKPKIAVSRLVCRTKMNLRGRSKGQFQRLFIGHHRRPAGAHAAGRDSCRAAAYTEKKRTLCKTSKGRRWASVRNKGDILRPGDAREDWSILLAGALPMDGQRPCRFDSFEELPRPKWAKGSSRKKLLGPFRKGLVAL